MPGSQPWLWVSSWLWWCGESWRNLSQEPRGARTSSLPLPNAAPGARPSIWLKRDKWEHGAEQRDQPLNRISCVFE